MAIVMNSTEAVPTRIWDARAIVSLGWLTLCAGAFGACILMYLHDGTSVPLVTAIGIILGKGGTVVDYFIGSSLGSQGKDAVIANLTKS